MTHLVAVSSAAKRSSLFHHLDAAPRGPVECYRPFIADTRPVHSDGVEMNKLQFNTPTRKREDGKTQQSLVYSNYQSFPPLTE